jgi:hypothetical protein
VPEAALAARRKYYQPQMDAYVETLASATDADARGALLFTSAP